MNYAPAACLSSPDVVGRAQTRSCAQHGCLNIPATYCGAVNVLTQGLASTVQFQVKQSIDRDRMLVIWEPELVH